MLDHPDLVIKMDDALYDFSSYASLGILTDAAVASFLSRQSRNELVGRRLQTNRNIYQRMRSFLGFALRDGDAGLNTHTCQRYEDDLIARKLSPATRSSNYTCALNIMRDAIQFKMVANFAVPRNFSRRKAAVLSDGRGTLADQLVNYSRPSATHNDLNRELLARLRQFCWRRIHQVRDRQAQGFAWREALAGREHVEHPVGKVGSWTRDEVLRVVVQTQWLYGNGDPTHQVFLPSGIEARKYTRFILDRASTKYEPIRQFEINDYLHPSYQHVAAFLPLFAMKRMNPSVILELATDMMILEACARPNFRLIRIDKGRVGREQNYGPYAVGSLNARTVPRAWMILREIIDRVRDKAPAHEQHLLVLAAGETSPDAPEIVLRSPRAYDCMRKIDRMIRKSKSPDDAILRAVDGPWCLATIRTTVINTDRRSGSLESTRLRTMHKRRETLDGYLKSPDIRAMLDDQIEHGQNHMFDFVRSHAIGVAPTVSAVMEASELTEAQAEELIDDRYNLGYGISLVQEHAFVVQTPLNCLRMLIWTETMEAAGERLEADGPERWRGYWLPQIALFRRALQDFPRKIVLQAEQMRGTVSIIFPEPY